MEVPNSLTVNGFSLPSQAAGSMPSLNPNQPNVDEVAPLLSLVFALLVAAAVSFAFRSTRPLGVLCTALFAFLSPVMTLTALAVGLVVLFFINRR